LKSDIWENDMNNLKHKKGFGVYLWDTFDNETLLLKGGFKTAEAALTWARNGHPENPNGADKIDIVDSGGNIVRQYSIG
jgi:hypothetical protein